MGLITINYLYLVMKKTYIAAMVMAALAMASCQKGQYAGSENGKSVSFTAYAEGSSERGSSKTVLNDHVSEWAKDTIWVLNGEGDWKKSYSTEAVGAGKAVFTEDYASVIFPGGPAVAVCPKYAGTYASWTIESDFPNKICGLYLSPEQTPVAGTYDPNAHISLAYTENEELHFKNLVALLKFTVTEPGVENVTIESHASNTMSGTFSVSFVDENYYFDYYYVEGLMKAPRVYLNGNMEAGKTYYAAVLPGEYHDFGVFVNGKLFKSKTGTVFFERNKIYDLGEIAPVKVDDGAQECILTVTNKNDWTDLHVYAWVGSGSNIFGAWPGTPVVDGQVTFPKEYYGKTVKYIVNDGGKGKQTFDLEQKLDGDFTITIPGTTPEPDTFLVLDWPYVDTYIYYWGTGINGPNWPGHNISGVIPGVAAWQMSDDFKNAKEFNFIINSGLGGFQTIDLSIDNAVKYDNGGYVYTYDAAHLK